MSADSSLALEIHEKEGRGWTHTFLILRKVVEPKSSLSLVIDKGSPKSALKIAAGFLFKHRQQKLCFGC